MTITTGKDNSNINEFLDADKTITIEDLKTNFLSTHESKELAIFWKM